MTLARRQRAFFSSATGGGEVACLVTDFILQQLQCGRHEFAVDDGVVFTLPGLYDFNFAVPTLNGDLAVLLFSQPYEPVVLSRKPSRHVERTVGQRGKHQLKTHR
jgi:hypothetical protein